MFGRRKLDNFFEPNASGRVVMEPGKGSYFFRPYSIQDPSSDETVHKEFCLEKLCSEIFSPKRACMLSELTQASYYRSFSEEFEMVLI